MLIVDAQVHIWAADTPERPWPEGRGAQAHRAEPFSVDDLLGEMDRAGVDRAVLVPPSWEGDRNDLAIEAARAHPDRLAVMGRLALQWRTSPDMLRRWREQPGMLGLRFTFHTPQSRPWLTDGTADWIWELAQEAGLPVMVFPPGALAALRTVAERYPTLRLVVDHMGIPGGRKNDEAFADLPQLLDLAACPNVAVKVTSLPGYSTDPYPYRNLHHHIRRIVDAFGPERCFWGTDLTRLPCPYRQAVTMFTEEMPFLSEADKEWIMGRGVCEWLGWPLP